MLGNLAKAQTREFNVLRANLVSQIRRRKRVLSTDKVVHEYASGPAIERLLISFILSLEVVNFRCNVVRCAKKHLATFRTVHHFGKTEIDDSELHVFVQKTVLRFEVSMDNIVAVNVVDAAHEHAHNATNVFFGKQTLIGLRLVAVHFLFLVVDYLLQFVRFL